MPPQPDKSSEAIIAALREIKDEVRAMNAENVRTQNSSAQALTQRLDQLPAMLSPMMQTPMMQTPVGGHTPMATPLSQTPILQSQTPVQGGTPGGNGYQTPGAMQPGGPQTPAGYTPSAGTP